MYLAPLLSPYGEEQAGDKTEMVVDWAAGGVMGEGQAIRSRDL